MPRPERPPAIDRHALYELAVQEPEKELAVVERVLQRSGRTPLRLREDFSGTALLSATWIARGPRRSAVAVDNDPEVLEWARTHRLPALGADASRLNLVEADVRRAPRGPFDAVIAFNFSYRAFFERDELARYFANVRRALAPRGAFVFDAFGGWIEQQGRVTERRRLAGGVTYVWEQMWFDAITHRMRSAIHFKLPGGKQLRKAFVYDWRLWTLPELTDLLREAGFSAVDVLWDATPPGVEPDYQPTAHAPNGPAWLSYVAAIR